MRLVTLGGGEFPIRGVSRKLGFRQRLSYPPDFSPGDGFQYSNTNTVLLGMIIEELTGQPLEQAYQERLFVPLGMSSTLLPERSSAAIPDPHPRGYMYQ